MRNQRAAETNNMLLNSNNLQDIISNNQLSKIKNKIK